MHNVPDLVPDRVTNHVDPDPESDVVANGITDHVGPDRSPDAIPHRGALSEPYRVR